jgi:NADH-quinone oxidoreductase subunit G
MITVTIDGTAIQTEPTKTIIEAAFENGIYVPHFCWHPALSISGNCRMCLVEVEKMPKQVIACSTLCTDGMIVRVNSEKAVRARSAVMEFILINHPLDCPICDEAGECKLQDYTYKHSVGESRFDEEKNHKRKRDPLGPNVMFDAERCISCSRCIRFCEDVAGYPQLTFVNRGDRVTIETFPGKTLDNPYAMNVIDICPVGALTSVDFRFKARVWDMAPTDSVCPGCSRGCNLKLWTRQNTILRATPRENQEVNNFWLCDHGRLEAWRHAHAPARLTAPQLRSESGLRKASWDDALDAVAAKLKARAGSIAAIGSAYNTLEDNFALARFQKEHGGADWIDVIPHALPGTGDAFLLTDDKTPNSAGTRLLGMGPSEGGASLAAMIAAMRAGRITAAIVTDAKAADSAELLDALATLPYVVAIVDSASPLTERAHAVLPASTFAEVLGTFLNVDTQLQLIRPALITRGRERWAGGYQMSRLDRFGSEYDRWGKLDPPDAKPVWSILAQIAGRIGSPWNYSHPEDVFEDMTSKIDALSGLDYERLGHRGIRLLGPAPARMLPYIYTDVHQ